MTQRLYTLRMQLCIVNQSSSRYRVKLSCMEAPDPLRLQVATWKSTYSIHAVQFRGVLAMIFQLYILWVRCICSICWTLDDQHRWVTTAKEIHLGAGGPAVIKCTPYKFATMANDGKTWQWDARSHAAHRTMPPQDRPACRAHRVVGVALRHGGTAVVLC